MKRQTCLPIITVGIIGMALIACRPASEPTRQLSNESSNEVKTIDWNDNLSILDLAVPVGGTAQLNCPPDGSLESSVWGTDIYTDDSSVCAAAVHAGLLNVRRGGDVTIQVVEGQNAYTGSKRNGVNSADYDEWGVSFQFVP